MSAIIFHSESGESRVWGAERAMMNKRVGDILVAALNLGDGFLHGGEHVLRPYLRGPSYLDSYTGKQWVESARMSVCSVLDDSTRIEIDGMTIGAWQLGLNTALAAGSAPIRLSARLHAQCEIHAWVDGPNRKWLAGVIQEGLDASIFREKCGWEDTIKLLLKNSKRPVVTSYTVTDQFPNPAVCGWEPKRETDGGPCWDDWYDIPRKQQWAMCVKALRDKPRGEEISPALEEIHFGPCALNAFQVMERIYNKKKAAEKSA